MLEIEIFQKLDIEPDYIIKDKPPFPPKLKFFVYVPYFKYTPLTIIEDTKTIQDFNYKYIQEKTFGFCIQYALESPKNMKKEIEHNIYNLNKKFHLLLDIEDLTNRINKLYCYDYFRFGEVHVKYKEKMIISQEYINDRIKNKETS